MALLIVTSTGAEGLDLKATRHIHIMEPYWHWSRISQVLFRGIRMGSHLELPKSERNVQPYMYLSDYPASSALKELADEMGQGSDHIRKQMEKENTTDVDLYNKAKQNQLLIDSFLSALQDASIDCAIHYTNRDCRVCSPTDEPLFIPDIGKDMQVKSPCVPIEEKKVKAKSVLVTAEDPNGDPIKQEYMYIVINDEQTNAKTPKIFEYVEALDGYKEIFADHQHYDAAYTAIKKREKLK